MKVAVVGSRDTELSDISKYIPKEATVIISGGARGIDTLAENYAQENGIPTEVYLPNYEKYGKKAPLLRNKTIVDKADIVVAIWNGESTGTKYTIDYAEKKSKKVMLHIENNRIIQFKSIQGGRDMDYQEAYKILFNAITKAIDLTDNVNINKGDVATAVNILKEAQQETEEMYMQAGE